MHIAFSQVHYGTCVFPGTSSTLCSTESVVHSHSAPLLYSSGECLHSFINLLSLAADITMTRVGGDGGDWRTHVMPYASRRLLPKEHSVHVQTFARSTVTLQSDRCNMTVIFYGSKEGDLNLQGGSLMTAYVYAIGKEQHRRINLPFNHLYNLNLNLYFTYL